MHADSPSLDQIGKLVDQPLTGIGKVDATITGNRTALQAAGNVTGDGVKYGNNGALALSTDFTAKVPDLDVVQASVAATTHGTFVSVAGQNINDLTAKTDYANKQLDVRRDGDAAEALAERGRLPPDAPRSSGDSSAAPRAAVAGRAVADGTGCECRRFSTVRMSWPSRI